MTPRNGAWKHRRRRSKNHCWRSYRPNSSATLSSPARRSSILDRAPGNDAPIGGLKVITKSGWFAARPSGTEDIYKIYAESFRGEEHLDRILEEAQDMVDRAVGVKRRAAKP